MNLRCRLGLHDFAWPPHHLYAWEMWSDLRIECARGCGARRVRRCRQDEHWTERHPDDRAAEVSQEGKER
jgi:hypothetical protein